MAPSGETTRVRELARGGRPVPTAEPGQAITVVFTDNVDVARGDVVLGATGVLVVFLLGGVVTQFAAIFAALHITLPAITIALIAASAFARENAPLLTAVGVGLVVLAAGMIRSPRMRAWRDTVA